MPEPRELFRALGIDLDPDREVVTWAAAAFTVVVYADEEAVPYAGGEYVIPRRFFCSWKLEERVITLDLGNDRGELVLNAVYVRRGDGAAALSPSLRGLGIRRLMEASGTRAAMRVVRNPDGAEELRPVILGDEIGGWLKAFRGEAHVPQRGRRLKDEDLREATAIYRAALATGRPPTEAVAKELSMSRSNAGRWVMEMRRRGFLGEAPAAGRAGETTTVTAPPATASAASATADLGHS